MNKEYAQVVEMLGKRSEALCFDGVKGYVI